MRKAVRLEMMEVVAAWRKGAGVSRVLVRARLEAGLLIFNVKSHKVTSSANCFSMLLCLRKWNGKRKHHGIPMGHHERLRNIRFADGPFLASFGGNDSNFGM